MDDKRKMVLINRLEMIDARIVRNKNEIYFWSREKAAVVGELAECEQFNFEMIYTKERKQNED